MINEYLKKILVACSGLNSKLNGGFCICCRENEWCYISTMSYIQQFFDFVIVSQVFMFLLNLIDPQDPGRFIACISNKEKERRGSCTFIAFACIASQE